MKIAYIAHPIGGNVVKNLSLLCDIVKEVNYKEPETVPFVPYYADVVALDDDDPIQRERGFKNNLEIISRGLVDELRLYGPRISHGMEVEIKRALMHEIQVKAMSSKLEKELINFIKKTYYNE